jgi:peptidoglycan/xylan/chitin deacetylase (PgdA/CDA1 family)
MKDKKSVPRLATKQSSAKAIILLYHQVINTKYDPFKLTVSPRNFLVQMRYLKKNYNIISLDKLVYYLRQGRIPSKSVVITFDDGYVDNYLYARPILEELGIPATFFIVSSYVNTNRLFWWDRLARIFHPERKLPTLALKINKIDFSYKLANPDKRKEAFWYVWGLLKYSSPQVIDRSISCLERWAKLNEVEDSFYRTMNEKELNKMAKSRLFRIGAHTHQHSQLSQQTLRFQIREIKKCKQRLEKIIQSPINLFSYPYGSKQDYNAQNVRILKESGFAAACSAFAGIIERKCNLYELPRCCVKNWDISWFKKALKLFSPL